VLRKHQHAQLHRVGLDDDHRRGPRAGRERVGDLHEHPVIALTEGGPIDRRVRIGGDRGAGQHQHKIGGDAGWVQHHIDGRGRIREGILQIGAQSPERVGAAPAQVAHQLQTGGSGQKAPIQQLGGQLASATAGGADDGDVHGGSEAWAAWSDLRPDPVRGGTSGPCGATQSGRRERPSCKPSGAIAPGGNGAMTLLVGVKTR